MLLSLSIDTRMLIPLHPDNNASPALMSTFIRPSESPISPCSLTNASYVSSPPAQSSVSGFAGRLESASASPNLARTLAICSRIFPAGPTLFNVLLSSSNPPPIVLDALGVGSATFATAPPSNLLNLSRASIMASGTMFL
ncbi:hypothetical protein BPOR_0099g00170 [Botrytis porri]|uniref:Uncharacterized protein n=1 Tax=Botrytis porri TaxID=87229 RepID=A0A4Z1KYN6_9HELO|nr:hypothetical protein BPOR_0099g00170 [Botrytis porri]